MKGCIYWSWHLCFEDCVFWLVVGTDVVLWVTGYVSLSYGLKLCGVQIYLLASLSVLWPHFASRTISPFSRVKI